MCKFLLSLPRSWRCVGANCSMARSIEADSSMDSLNCSASMFNYLCSFHQVPLSFLDNVFSFGATLSPLDCGLAMFCSEDTLLARDSQLVPVPSFGRSGREIRQSYLLRAAEPSDSVPSWSWGTRQLAVYHCFDIVTGRTTWITVKGNSGVNDLINEAVSRAPEYQQGSPRTLAESFSATLDIHLMILDWCDENWRWCINDIEKAARRIVDKAKCARIDEGPHFAVIPEDIRQKMLRPSTFNSKTVSRSTTIVGSIQSGAENIHSFLKRASFGKSAPLRDMRKNTGQQLPAQSSQQPAFPAADSKNRLDTLARLDMFSFKELQELQVVAEKVQDALLVVKLNAAVLAQIRAYYRDLMETESVPLLTTFQHECRHDLLQFLARIDGIEQKLLIRREQLKSLLLFVRDGKTLVRPLPALL